MSHTARHPKPPATATPSQLAASPAPMPDVAAMASTPLLQRMIAVLARQAAREYLSELHHATAAAASPAERVLS